jgi:hypothetical protein
MNTLGAQYSELKLKTFLSPETTGSKYIARPLAFLSAVTMHQREVEEIAGPEFEMHMSMINTTSRCCDVPEDRSVK